MLDDIYILHDYVKTVNDKMSDIDTSRVIRRIVTYHYTVPTVVWMVVAKEIVTNHELWGRSRFFNDETQKNRKRHALRG